MELKKHVLSSCNNRSLEAEMEVEVALGWRPQYYILISVLNLAADHGPQPCWRTGP